ncbi:MAG: 30S ribosomal protein S6 [Armatimonadetes bacterium]|nr:30S ribosomal protein S6 [Armatimonadota bacterium]
MEERVKLYECMYILDPRLDGADTEAAIRGLHDVVAEFGGTVKNDYDWGRRRFAYKIGPWTEGQYRIMYFEGTGEVAKQVKRHGVMDARIIRTLVVVANPATMYRPAGEEPLAEEAVAEVAGPAPEGNFEPGASE